VRLLIDLGYTRVRDFDGGIAEWIAAGLAVEREGTLLSPSIPVAPMSSARKSRMSSLASPLPWVSRERG
jgi:3-mercaptopyruvate sulfurtransferase SseA